MGQGEQSLRLAQKRNCCAIVAVPRVLSSRKSGKCGRGGTSAFGLLEWRVLVGFDRLAEIRCARNCGGRGTHYETNDHAYQQSCQAIGRGATFLNSDDFAVRWKTRSR